MDRLMDEASVWRPADITRATFTTKPEVDALCIQ